MNSTPGSISFIESHGTTSNPPPPLAVSSRSETTKAFASSFFASAGPLTELPHAVTNSSAGRAESKRFTDDSHLRVVVPAEPRLVDGNKTIDAAFAVVVLDEGPARVVLGVLEQLVKGVADPVVDARRFAHQP